MFAKALAKAAAANIPPPVKFDLCGIERQALERGKIEINKLDAGDVGHCNRWDAKRIAANTRAPRVTAACLVSFIIVVTLIGPQH